MTDFTMRVADEADVPYVMALQRANRESVGGLPTPAITERVQRGTVVLGILNDEPMGYLLWDYRAGVVRIPQACIQYDARRRKYGEALAAWIVQRHPDANEVRLRCAADLEANLFWRSMGFVCTGVMQGGKRRGRLLNAWTLWLAPTLLIHTTPPAAQLRVDCMYDDTDYLLTQPEGFQPITSLPKLAWSNRAEA